MVHWERAIAIQPQRLKLVLDLVLVKAAEPDRIEAMEAEAEPDLDRVKVAEPNRLEVMKPEPDRVRVMQ
jgi:hypothetical protein